MSREWRLPFLGRVGPGCAVHRFDAWRFCDRPAVGADGIGALPARVDALLTQG
jgi:hypothetical protein